MTNEIDIYYKDCQWYYTKEHKKRDGYVLFEGLSDFIGTILRKEKHKENYKRVLNHMIVSNEINLPYVLLPLQEYDDLYYCPSTETEVWGSPLFKDVVDTKKPIYFDIQ